MRCVLTVAAIDRLRRNGKGLKGAAVEGTKDQIRPVFMMVLVAMLGMLPAALASGIGSDVQRPLPRWWGRATLDFPIRDCSDSQSVHRCA